MSYSEEPRVGVSAWADLASVRRTLEWVGLDAERIEHSRYTGANVVRLLDRISSADGLSPDVGQQVKDLSAAMAGFDAADVDGRTAVLSQARLILDSLISIGELGARNYELEKKGRYSAPNRRDRNRNRNRSEKKAADGEGTEVDASTEGASSSSPDESTKSVASAPVDGEEAPLTDVAPTEPSDAGEAEQANDGGEPEPVVEPPPEPSLAEIWGLPRHSPAPPQARPPRRFALGHPNASGRPISSLGVAESVVDALSKAGLEACADLLVLPPKTHVRIRQAVLAAPGGEAEVDVADTDLGTEEDPVIVRGRLRHRCVRLTATGKRYEVSIEVRKVGLVRCTWIGTGPRGWHRWTSNLELAFIGVPEDGEDGWQIFDAEPVGVDGRGSGWTPAYEVEDVDDRLVRDLVARVLIDTMGCLRDPLPRNLVEHHKLIGLHEALRDVHFPSNTSGKGRSRLAFEELLLLQAGIGWRARSRHRQRGVKQKISHSIVGDLSAQQQVQLSDSQEAAFSEIRRDMGSAHAMVRLLQGEVGTDKHSVAVLAAAVVIENGGQALFVLPDGAAAERRFLFSEGLFRSAGRTPLLVPDKPNRGHIDAIKRGESHVVFGTKALLESITEWKNLSLVVVEERDEFGTITPGDIVKKGPTPDLLVITEMPIPHSLTLTVFGEYQMSMIQQDSPVRATSQVFLQAERKEAYALASEHVAEGRQAFVVFPVGNDGDLLGPDDALRYAEALQKEAFSDAKIGIYCSAMSRDDRLRVFQDFQHRRIDVLVATTYVEEAPVVHNGTMMVVEHADHHDVARLHRLRGHVGFGAEPGLCLFVMSDSPSAEAEDRLRAVCVERDGFRIAEMDLKERGWEGLLGERAVEAPNFLWADPVMDHEYLLNAREEAFRIVQQDPGMRRFQDLALVVKQRWGDWLGEDMPTPKMDNRRNDDSDNGKGRGRRRRRRRRR